MLAIFIICVSKPYGFDSHFETSEYRDTSAEQ